MMIPSITVRKIIFLSAGKQRSLCQTATKFSPIERMSASSSAESEWRFSERAVSCCRTISISSSFSFHRRSNSAAANRFLASTTSYCSKARLASYCNCSSFSFDGEQVTFRWKDYAHGNKQRLMTLSASEFLRRYVQHVLPHGF